MDRRCNLGKQKNVPSATHSVIWQRTPSDPYPTLSSGSLSVPYGFSCQQSKNLGPIGAFSDHQYRYTIVRLRFRFPLAPVPGISSRGLSESNRFWVMFGSISALQNNNASATHRPWDDTCLREPGNTVETYEDCSTYSRHWGYVVRYQLFPIWPLPDLDALGFNNTR